MDMKINCIDEKLIPAYAHNMDAAFDLRASGEFVVDLDTDNKEVNLDFYELKPMERILVKTGLKIALPENCYASIRDRSGIAFKNGISTMGGVIDFEYRGEIGVILVNLSNKVFRIEKYDRIAQMIIQPFKHVNLTPVEELGETTRSSDGFGSTGLK
jgi:dUTP pyrophosphatase